MRLSALHLDGFRNCKGGVSAPFSRFNGIFGQNGRGKTNYLEAIYYLSHLKSWRSSRRCELISWDAGEATLSASFEVAQRESDLTVRISAQSREVKLDGKAISLWRDYGAKFVAVLFSPEHTGLLRDEPECRRAALDEMGFHRDPTYLSLLRRYHLALKEKNAALRTGRFSASAEALVWNETLVLAGASLVSRRLALFKEIFPLLSQIYARIAAQDGARRGLSLSLKVLGRELSLEECEAWGEKEAEAHFRMALDARASEELRRGMALVGPHRDDWSLYLDGRAVASTASQGEHRSLVIALKLAELVLLKRHSGEAPLFLLDDLTSELDENRRRFLIDSLSELECQVFLTSTDSALFAELIPASERRFFELG